MRKTTNSTADSNEDLLITFSSFCPNIGNFFLAHCTHIAGVEGEMGVSIER
jgi:hypothetical protein